jgi:EAL domain-containing protein (putative c-di-GMP-specific phosphodiesterase class I)
MRCNSRGVAIQPNQFIPVAEKTGLIIRLGEWTMLTAARLADHLIQSGRPTKIAVNVSRAQLTAPKFRQVLYGVLACSDVPPSLIELELTESLFMDTSETVRNNLAAAVEAGFPLAIDDFGTGYSCLAYLKDLPARKLKLDRAFVKGLPEDRKSFAIIRTITQLAADLGMTIVAEGVETDAQRDILAEAGVTALQGFLLSYPLPETELETWLATHY